MEMGGDTLAAEKELEDMRANLRSLQVCAKSLDEAL
jgi:hypothetical protein